MNSIGYSALHLGRSGVAFGNPKADIAAKEYDSRVFGGSSLSALRRKLLAADASANPGGVHF